jgi:transcriptional regulator with XRE-family HTH domain
MKQKSLRQLAKELGVSASYLSQVKNGKRPASRKLLSKVLSSVGQETRQEVDIYANSSYNKPSAGVAELADAADLKSAGVILVGSSPTPGTS